METKDMLNWLRAKRHFLISSGAHYWSRRDAKMYATITMVLKRYK